MTLPAHASIFTGNYPPTHTVRSNGIYVLPEQQTTLAEVLVSRGFHGAAFVASFVLDRRFGLGQGFEHYDDKVWSGVEELEKLEAERTAEEVFDVFSAWLTAQEAARPSFIWIHLYDPHAPYEPPEPYRTRYADDPYAGEVAYVDEVVGSILDRLDRAGRLGSTLVAVVGDHGEGLGEHGEQTHSLLIYNSTLHVPMILWSPGTVPQGRRVDDLVRIIDLAPTILDYLGIDQALGEGTSLRSLIERVDPAAAEIELVAYSESFYPELALGWSPLRGLESSDHRLILAPTPELYAVDTDPGELDNRALEDTGAYQRLKRQLVDVMGSFAEDSERQSAAAGSLDAATRARLESLGYVAAQGAAGSREGPPVNPMERIGMWNRIQFGIAQSGRGAYRQAVDSFESVLADDPDIPMVYEYLGTAWQKLGNLAKAEEVYRAALERGIEAPRLHHELGRILAERGERGAAKRELRVTLALDPQSVVAHYDLARLFQSEREWSTAAEHYAKAVELNPSYLWAWNGMAMTLAAQGDMQRATDAFRRVVEIDPENAPGVFNLAVQLERVGLAQEAAETYRQFLGLDSAADFSAERRQAEAALDRLEN